MATEKQKLARRRNWFKLEILGIHFSKYGLTTTEEEDKLIEQISELRNQLIRQFDENSKKLGLKVPEHRCWCGKEGKYPTTLPYIDSICERTVTHLCKKHRDEN